jgi:PKHD-type hydroxylase
MRNTPRLFHWISLPAHVTHPELPQNDGIVLPTGRINAFSKTECDEILRVSQELAPEKQAYTGDGGTEITQSFRNSRVRTIPPHGETSWVFDKLESVIAGLLPHFKFDVAGFFEGAQVYYYPTDGFLDWHMDIGKGFMSTRKLSITLQLSEESEYDGGDLEFMSSEKAPRGRGTMIIFPTYMMHRVSKVTRGERYSLVSWVHGPPYR